MIDLRSDTVTRPGEAMRRAAAEAEVGDDVFGEDPTVNELQARVAERLGMAAALYVPSGTMGNQVAANVHAEPGEEVVLEADSHLYNIEAGGLAYHSRLQPRPVDGGPTGALAPADVEANVVAPEAHGVTTGLVALEDTHNMKGGTAIPPAAITAVAEAAHDHGVPVHLDGARLWNAAVALDEPPDAFTAAVDSVMVSLSKGLGAPVGSVLAGSEAFVDRARAARRRFGGGMRQVGVLAGPGLVALDNVDRLAEDHANAARLASGLDAVDGLSVPEPDTNILLVDVSDLGVSAAELLAAVEEAGVRGLPVAEDVIRLVTHLDVSAADVDEAVAAFEEAAAAVAG